jgi:hypothetical protein
MIVSQIIQFLDILVPFSYLGFTLPAGPIKFLKSTLLNTKWQSESLWSQTDIQTLCLVFDFLCLFTLQNSSPIACTQTIDQSDRLCR